MPVPTPKSIIDLEKLILTESIKKSFLIDLLTTNNAIYRDQLISIIRLYNFYNFYFFPNIMRKDAEYKDAEYNAVQFEQLINMKCET